MAVCWAVGRYVDNLRDRWLVAGWGKAACTVFWISREDGVVDLIQFLFRAHSILKVCSPQSNKLSSFSFPHVFSSLPTSNRYSAGNASYANLRQKSNPS